MTDSPARSPQHGGGTSGHTSGSGGSGLGNVFKNLTNPFKSSGSSSTNTTPKINPQVIGKYNGMDLDDLLAKAGAGNSNSTRIAAVNAIRSLLIETVVSSIPEIWYQTRDIIGKHNVLECRRAGFRLLEACITHDEHVVGARMTYCQAILSNGNLDCFDLQLNCLRSLTNDGRDMGDLVNSGYPFSHVVCSWLRRVANEVQEIRYGRKRDIAEPWTTMKDNFHEILKFIEKSIKFNITAFDEESLGEILREMVGICRKTSSKDDIKYCIAVVDTVMVYGFLPMENLGGILEVLCGVAITVEEQSGNAWQTVQNLAMSHAAVSTVSHLCEILTGSFKREVNSNTMRGAAKFLMKLFRLSVDPEEDRYRDMCRISVRFILKALVDSIKVSSLRHGMEVCNCVLQMLTDEPIRNSIPYELWSGDNSPFEAVYALSRYETVQRRSRKHAADNGYAQGQPGDDIVGQVVIKIGEICQQLKLLLDDSKKFPGPREALVDTLLDLSDYSDDECALKVINCFEEDHFCNPMNKNWSENLKTLIEHYYNDPTRSTYVRVEVVKLARDVYSAAKDINARKAMLLLIDNIFCNIDQEVNTEVLSELMSFFVTVAVACDGETFDKMCTKLHVIFNQYDEEEINDPQPVENFAEFIKERSIRGRALTKAFGHLFTLTFRYSPLKACRAYFYLLQYCTKTVKTDQVVFLEAAKLLCRIRVTSENYVYLTNPNNMDGLAGSVGHSVKTGTLTGDELWKYPEELSYLSTENLDVPSAMLKRGARSVVELKEIDIRTWLKLMINILKNGAPWEVYSFVMAHLAPQLSNMQLFSDYVGEIFELWELMCDQISTGKLPNIKLPTNVNRLETLVALIRSMSSIIGYNAMFNKQHSDRIVQAFVLGLSSWETTAVPCINGLVICCYEFPLSVKKFMFQIFNKLQMAITTTKTTPHVLEFLLSLSRLPRLTDNFTLEDYKRVFGMAFKYIQHANDLSTKNPPRANETDEVWPSMTQYLLALAYNVIANWFLTLKLSRRKEMATFITRNLIIANGQQNDIADQSLATLDLISRFTYSDLDLVMQPPTTRMSPMEGSEVKKWIYGTSVVTLETHLETGYSQLIVRRPTGTTMFNIRPDEKTVPQHLREKVMLMHENDADDTEEKEIKTDSLQLFSPSYMFLQTILPTHPDSSFKPLLLYDDAATQRAISAFDRTPVVDFHKVGVMYIAPGQNTEQEILGNQVGSRAYRKFLSQLGTLIRLKGNKSVYTAGLDTENDIDGEYAYAWNDKITQMIYHTTTLMPNNPNDTSFSAKKRHIGNNYVSIYYDESGLAFNFDVIKSMFNFINIVVSPHTAEFQPDSGMQDLPKKRQYYRVRAYRRDGVPALFAACHLKTVSQEALPLFVRNLALIASKFATVWHSEGQYISNWRYRLQQIRQLQDRTLTQRQEEVQQRKNQEASNERRNSAVAMTTTSSSSNGGVVNGSDGSNSAGTVDSSSTNNNNDDNEVDDELPLLKNLAFSSFT